MTDPPTSSTGPEPEGEELTSQTGDNSLGRLLSLCDGVFAIAMTLLALDLVVPSLGAHPTDAALRQALGARSDDYLSFLISFYLVAGYWSRHRYIMRSVREVHPKLVRDTLFLLFLVAGMPFPASLLGQYGGTDGIALAIYGAFNVLATLSVVLISQRVRKYRLAAGNPAAVLDIDHKVETWANLVVFVICIPSGYLLGTHAPYVLLLLLISGRAPTFRRWIMQSRRARADRSAAIDRSRQEPGP